MPSAIRRQTMSVSPKRWPVPFIGRNQSRSHDAPHHDCPGRIRREEVGEMVHGEARLRDPRAPRSLDHGGTEDGEHRVSLVRGLLPPRAREQRYLVHDERCEEGRSRAPEARCRVHHPDDEEDWATYAMFKDPDGNEFYLIEE